MKTTTVFSEDRGESVFNRMKCSHYIKHHSLLRLDWAAYINTVGSMGERERSGTRGEGQGWEGEMVMYTERWRTGMGRAGSDRETGDWRETRQTVVTVREWQLHRWPLNDLSLDMLLSIKASEAINIRERSKWGQSWAWAHPSLLKSRPSGMRHKSGASLPKPSYPEVSRLSSEKHLPTVKGLSNFLWFEKKKEERETSRQIT